MRKSFTTKYGYGDRVYLKTKPDEIRVIVGFVVRQKSVEYLSKVGDDEFCNRDVEIESANSKVFKVKGFIK